MCSKLIDQSACPLSRIRSSSSPGRPLSLTAFVTGYRFLSLRKERSIPVQSWVIKPSFDGSSLNSFDISHLPFGQTTRQSQASSSDALVLRNHSQPLKQTTPKACSHFFSQTQISRSQWPRKVHFATLFPKPTTPNRSWSQCCLRLIYLGERMRSGQPKSPPAASSPTSPCTNVRVSPFCPLSGHF